MSDLISTSKCPIHAEDLHQIHIDDHGFITECLINRLMTLYVALPNQQDEKEK